MKTSEIVLGRRYVGHNGTVREVIAEGPKYKLYDAQADKDCVRWRLVKHGSRKTAPIGEEGNTTRNSFARWATTAVPVQPEGLTEKDGEGTGGSRVGTGSRLA